VRLIDVPAHKYLEEDQLFLNFSLTELVTRSCFETNAFEVKFKEPRSGNLFHLHSRKKTNWAVPLAWMWNSSSRHFVAKTCSSTLLSFYLICEIVQAIYP